jgi:hypothetical protein
MKGFGKIAHVFSLLGGLMVCFIPVQFSRKRALSSTEKAEYALTVDYYKRHTFGANLDRQPHSMSELVRACGESLCSLRLGLKSAY